MKANTTSNGHLEGWNSVTPMSISTHTVDVENNNVQLSSLLEGFRVVRNRLDGKSVVREGSIGKNEMPLEMGLLKRQQDALCYQQGLLCDLERELELLKEVI